MALGVPVSVVVVSPVSQVAAAAARPRVRLAAVAAEQDALHAQLVVVPLAVAADAAVVPDALHARLAVARRAAVAAAAAVPARHDELHVAPHRGLFAQQAVAAAVLELAPAPVVHLGPCARLAPGISVPSRDPVPGLHASS